MPLAPLAKLKAKRKLNKSQHVAKSSTSKPAASKPGSKGGTSKPTISSPKQKMNTTRLKIVATSANLKVN